ncbi:MAG: hypothetical protein ACLFQM_03705, partial [Fidelibacterota bacterium]
MNYLEWNNALGKWFFNEEKAEQEVYLFITIQDIIKVGKEHGVEGSNKDIFLDFIQAIKENIQESPWYHYIIEHALFTYWQWCNNLNKLNETRFQYPFYIGYLSLFVLPLTENQDNNFRADAYYPIAKKFLEKYDLPTMPYQSEKLNWNSIWKNLEEWSIDKKNTELGYFEIHQFKNKGWIYAGMALSQSIFPVQSFRKLPKFYEICNLVPGDKIENEDLKKYLLLNGSRYLDLSKRIIGIIKDSNNELGHSIINLIKRHYKQWSGTTDETDSNTGLTRRGNIIAPLRLCIEGDNVRGYKTYYRLYTKLDFPEDLTFTYNDK